MAYGNTQTVSRNGENANDLSQKCGMSHPHVLTV